MVFSVAMTDWPPSSSPSLILLVSCSGPQSFAFPPHSPARNLVYFCAPRASANVSLFDAPNLPSSGVLPCAPDSDPMTEPDTTTLTRPPPHSNVASAPGLGTLPPSPSLNSLMPGSVADTL